MPGGVLQALGRYIADSIGATLRQRAEVLPPDVSGKSLDANYPFLAKKMIFYILCSALFMDMPFKKPEKIYSKSHFRIRRMGRNPSTIQVTLAQGDTEGPAPG